MSSTKFGVYSLIFGLLALIVTFIGGPFLRAGPIIIIVSIILAVLFGIVGIVASKKDKNKATLVLSILGIVFGLIPLLIFLLALLRA